MALKRNIETFIGCDASYEDSSIVLFGAPFDSTTSFRPGARFGPAARAAGKSVGLRINPECSTQEGHEIYDPCAPGSRLGTTRAQWDAHMTPSLVELLDGLHFHTLCEQDSDALETTLDAVAKKFGDILPNMKWLNFGGGHHITRPEMLSAITALTRRCGRAIAWCSATWRSTPPVKTTLSTGCLCPLSGSFVKMAQLKISAHLGIMISKRGWAVKSTA